MSTNGKEFVTRAEIEREFVTRVEIERGMQGAGEAVGDRLRPIEDALPLIEQRLSRVEGALRMPLATPKAENEEHDDALANLQRDLHSILQRFDELEVRMRAAGGTTAALQVDPQ